MWSYAIWDGDWGKLLILKSHGGEKINEIGNKNAIEKNEQSLKLVLKKIINKPLGKKEKTQNIYIRN